MPELSVIIPQEHFHIVEFIQDGMPGVAAVNYALKAFQPKEVFVWHLSIMIEFEELVDNGMPSTKEREVIDAFEVLLDANIKGPDAKKPNALFFARITWNKTCELIWRVYEPEVANTYMQKIIEDKSPPRFFDYRIDHDEEWKLAEWALNALR
jgi:hypothetical protein